MTNQNKPRTLISFEKLDVEIQEQIKLEYPDGFSTHLINFQNKEGETLTALPFETEDKYYMVKMTVRKAESIISDDDDYDDDGMLKDDIKDEYQGKYGDDDLEFDAGDDEDDFADDDIDQDEEEL